jgi:hypothetical protein
MKPTSRTLLAFSLFLATAGAGLASVPQTSARADDQRGDTRADPSCRTVQGSASLTPKADCSSPVQICGEGTFTGGLKGSYSSELFTLTPTADTAVTQVVLFTAETTMPAAQVGHWRGGLVFKEAGAFHVAGAGEFSELYSVAGGTGDFVAATGVLQAVGTFVDVTGGGIVYQGQICVP